MGGVDGRFRKAELVHPPRKPPVIRGCRCKPIRGPVQRICRQWTVIIALTTAVLSAGCAPDSMDLSGAKSIPKSEGIAFGRIKVVWKGEEATSLTTTFGEKPWSIVILPDASSVGSDFHLSGNGSFIWHFPPGGYTIASFHGAPPLLLGSSTHIGGRISAHFNVVESASSYLGTLTLTFDGARYRMSVEDDYESASKDYALRFPGFETNLRKDLMVMERPR